MTDSRRSHSRPTRRLRGSFGFWLGLVLIVLVRGPLPLRATTANDLCAEDADPCIVSSRVSVTDGSTLAFGARGLFVVSGGILNVGSGAMIITAASLTIEAVGALQANERDVPGGRISVAAGTILIAGSVSADGTDGGTIALAASQALVTNGIISVNGTSGTGTGGSIELSGRVVTIAGDVTARGLAESVGGCVTVSSETNVDLAGKIRVPGGDGGEIVVVAGGDLRLASAANLSVSGFGTNGGSGGGIELTARGDDGIADGHVWLAGSLESRGASGQGGDGGCITVTAAGNLSGTDAKALLDVNSGAPDGFAGEINLIASGDVDLDMQLNAQGSGSEGAGGDIEVRAGGDLQLGERAAISVVGPGDGGTIDLIANRGEVTVASARVVASGTLGGDGGDIRIRASGAQGSIVLSGALFANGNAFGSAPGRGGSIDISAGYSFTLQGPPTQAGGRLQAQGGNGSGNGGTIAMRTLRGPLQVDGAVLAPGSGPASTGGLVTVASGGSLEVGGRVEVASNFQGGRIALEASGPVAVDGMLEASSLSAVTGSGGGMIDVLGAGPIAIAGQLTADGSSAAGTHGGAVTIRGCDVTVAESGLLSSVGDGGLNRLTGRRLIVISGELAATPTTGRNELVYRDVANPPIIFASATVVPAAILTVDASLPPCSVCGDTHIEPPETCDDGNQEDGDGCSSTCQVEAGQCDVDGDGDVDANDLIALETELFDGDGDRTMDVGGGDFPGTVGADANADGRVSGADIVHCIEVLGGE